MQTELFFGGYSVIINLFFFFLEFCDAGDTVFDASQYAFFGKDVVEEVELGGLEDEEDNLSAPTFDEEEFLFDKEEVYYFSNCFVKFVR